MNCAIHDELVLIIINLVFILQLSIKLLNFRFYNKEHNVLNKEDNNFNKLASWLEEICSSNLFIQIMKKYEIWNIKNKSIIISN